MQIIFIITLYRYPKHNFTPLHALDTSIMFNVHVSGREKIKKKHFKAEKEN
jgi:hypothetical protein